MKNILVVTYWDFNDPLIQTYTLPYLRVIDKVCHGKCNIHLVTFNQSQIDLRSKKYFSPVFFKYHSNKILASLSLLTTFIRLIFFIKKNKIEFIHAWCTPAGSLSHLLSKFTGKPLILDSFEPHAESMAENGTWKRGSLTFKLLFRFEKLQLKQAKHIIGLTASTSNYIKEAYQLEPQNIHLKPSCVDISDFSIYTTAQREELRRSHSILPEQIVGIYVGKFGGIYLNEEIYQIFKCCSLQWKSNFKLIILTPNDEVEVLEKLKHYDLDKHIVALKKANKEEVIRYLNLADFALNPVMPVPSKRYCTSIKDGEYWACGLPVIITKDISDDSDIIEDNNIGAVIHALDETHYAGAVLKIDSLLTKNKNGELSEKIKMICTRYRSFTLAENIYKEIYLND